MTLEEAIRRWDALGNNERRRGAGDCRGLHRERGRGMKGVVHVLSFFALAGAGGVFVGELKDHVSHIAAWSFLAMVALSLILALTSGSPEDGS